MIKKRIKADTISREGIRGRDWFRQEIEDLQKRQINDLEDFRADVISVYQLLARSIGANCRISVSQGEIIDTEIRTIVQQKKKGGGQSARLHRQM